MNVPAWLDPFWHVDYELESSLSADSAGAALQPRKGRLRGRLNRDGTVRLVRRGGLVNEFVRARAVLSPRGAGSNVRVHIARPSWVSGLFLLTLIGFIVVPLLQLIVDLMFDRLRLADAAVFLSIGAVIWVFVIGTNYTSAKSEARELEGLIRKALGVER